MVLNLFETLEQLSEKFKGWIIENGANPLLWSGLFLLGLVVFWFTYNALQKNK